MGAECLVSQPSTSIWKPTTMAIEIQKAPRRSRPVCSTNRSRASTASTASTAAAVYSGTRFYLLRHGRRGARRPRDAGDDLEREQRADRYGEKEHDLFHGNGGWHRPSCRVARRKE